MEGRWKAKQRGGRRRGSRNNLSPEITKKLGDANPYCAHGYNEDPFFGDFWAIRGFLSTLLPLAMARKKRAIQNNAQPRQSQKKSASKEIDEEIRDGISQHKTRNLGESTEMGIPRLDLDELVAQSSPDAPVDDAAGEWTVVSSRKKQASGQSIE